MGGGLGLARGDVQSLPGGVAAWRADSTVGASVVSPTAIEWVRNTDGTQGETWNPVTGCTKVSEGCDTVVLHPDRLGRPLRRRKPTTYFVNSMSDLFHDDVPDVFIADVFAVMAIAERHTFQILTKRPGRMASIVRSRRFYELVTNAVVQSKNRLLGEWPVSNVWLGTSVENQKWADVRIPKLLQTPAAVRFLSCEPLLGPLDLAEFVGHRGRCAERKYQSAQAGDRWTCDCPVEPRWVIVGGESGPGARPMNPDWARSLRDQCVAAGVSFFFKGWGEWTPGRGFDAGDLAPLDLVERGLVDGFMIRLGKKRAGRELDGRTWDGMPERGA